MHCSLSDTSSQVLPLLSPPLTTFFGGSIARTPLLPLGHISYRGNGHLTTEDKSGAIKVSRNAKQLGMIAGGSGITPMLQVSSIPTYTSPHIFLVSAIFYIFLSCNVHREPGSLEVIIHVMLGIQSLAWQLVATLTPEHYLI